MKIRSIALMALTAALMGSPAAMAQKSDAPAQPAMEPAPKSGDAPAPMTPAEATPSPTPAPAAPGAPPMQSVDAQIDMAFGTGQQEKVKTFLADLQKAAEAKDKKAVAKMIAYPFKTKVGDKDMNFENEREFAKSYDEVFNDKITAVIKAQTYDKLFVNSQGAMIGNGQVWFAKTGEGDKAEIKIIAVNQNAGA